MQEQYVIFELEEQKYGIGIEFVNEITEMVSITKVPNSEDYIEGIINLRGVVIPVINFKRLLNMKETKKEGNQILVLDYNDSLIGFVIDNADDVKTVDESNKEELDGSVEASSENFSGVLHLDGDIVLIVSAEEIMKNKIMNKDKYKVMTTAV